MFAATTATTRLLDAITAAPLERPASLPAKLTVTGQGKHSPVTRERGEGRGGVFLRAFQAPINRTAVCADWLGGLGRRRSGCVATMEATFQND